MTGALEERDWALLGQRAARVDRPRWLEVVSHLDPRYGGLSAAVPELGLSLVDGVGSWPLQISLAAFCAVDEQFTPLGFTAEQVSYWPASRSVWIRDRMHGGALREHFQEHLRLADGVHLHGLWEASTAVAAEAARSLGKPYVLSAHGMLEPWALASKRLKKLLYGRMIERSNVASATCLHALTRAEAEQYVRFGARSPIAVIPNAVECPADTDPMPFLQSHPALRGKRLVLFLARLHPKKGLDLLLEVWTTLAPQFPEAHLVIAGPDSEGTEARLRALVASRSLGDSVVFTGMLRGTMKWSALAAAEAFVLPSYSEGLSVSVLEAMAMGRPVVITEECHMPEVSRRGAGWVIAADADPLRGALADVLRARPAVNRAIGQRGQELIAERYCWPVVSRQMAEVYAWALGGRMPESVDLVFPA